MIDRTFGGCPSAHRCVECLCYSCLVTRTRSVWVDTNTRLVERRFFLNDVRLPGCCFLRENLTKIGRTVGGCREAVRAYIHVYICTLIDMNARVYICTKQEKSSNTICTRLFTWMLFSPRASEDDRSNCRRLSRSCPRIYTCLYIYTHRYECACIHTHEAGEE